MSSKPGQLFLLVVFLIHFFVFLRLALVRQKSDHLLFTVTFLLLISSLVLRLWWPDIEIFNRHLHFGLRTAAWVTSPVAAWLYLRRRLREKKERTRGGTMS